MINFESETMFTGKKEFNNKKGDLMRIYNFMGESGETFGVFAPDHLSQKLSKLEQFKKYLVSFNLSNYNNKWQLNINDIEV